MLITIAGMIGGGKSSLTKIITEEFGGVAYYENANSPILQKFYTASKEEQEAKRYPFLLQLEFLNSRYKMIKKCLLEGDNPKVNTLDRSIYEDFWFMEVNRRLGRISEDEAIIYSDLLDNMLEDLKELPKRSPDLLIYLQGSFETFKDRIQNRGRSFEAIDEETEAYFYKLWEGYDTWVSEYYKASPVLVIDIDKYDYVNNEEDKKEVLELVRTRLTELELI
jgi:deoxyadenosine/deoxycytidine kinase